MMLNSLVIKNFRMLEDFTVEKLGRVNLIVGKNNSGKSTVLEALRIYAGNANYNLLKAIAKSHDEEIYHKEPYNKIYVDVNLSNNIPVIIFESSYDALFTGRNVHNKIFIGETNSNEKQLYIYYESWIEKDNKTFPHKFRLDNFKPALGVYKNNQHYTIHPSAIIPLQNEACGFIPTQFIAIDELANDWNSIVSNHYDKIGIISDALKIIIPEYESLFFIPNSLGDTKFTPKVKVTNLQNPIPLKSLGDGMIRILQLALKLVSAQDGFLLIDEFENGLHYSVQENVWRLLFEMAEKLDIQVFATTHSWDCIEIFTKVALENEKTEGILFRMGRSAVNRTIGEREIKEGQVVARIYDKEALYDLTQMDIEVR